MATDQENKQRQEAPVGAISSAWRGPDSCGRDSLRLQGWIRCPSETIALLQVAIAGGEFVLAQHDQRDTRVEFFAEVPYPRSSSVAGEIYFVATLSSALTLTLTLPVPAELRTDDSELDAFGYRRERGGLDSAVLRAARRNTALNAERILRQKPHRTTHGPEFSVLIDGRVSAESLILCLNSLEEQSGATHEAIVICDIVPRQAITARFPHVRFLTITADREISALNRALGMSEGAFVLFLHGACIVAKGFMTAALGLLAQHPRNGTFTGKVIRCDGWLSCMGGNLWQDGDVSAIGECDNPGAPSYEYLFEVDLPSPHLVIARRDVLNSLGEFNERLKTIACALTEMSLRLKRTQRSCLAAPRLEVTLTDEYSFGYFLSSSFEPCLLAAAREAGYLSDLPAIEQQEKPHLPRPACLGNRVLLILDEPSLSERGSACFERSTSQLEHIRIIADRLRAAGSCVSIAVAGLELQHARAVIDRNDIEVVALRHWSDLGEFVRQRDSNYDCLWLTRPRQLQLLRSLCVAGNMLRVLDSRPRIIEPYNVIAGDDDEGRLYADSSLAEICSLAHLVITNDDRVRRKLSAIGVQSSCASEAALSEASRARSAAAGRRTEMKCFGDEAKNHGRATSHSVDYCRSGPLELLPVALPAVLRFPGKTPDEECYASAAGGNADASHGESRATVATVIVPIFNALDDLMCCIESLVAGADCEFDLILIDDASTDRRVVTYLAELRTCLTSPLLRRLEIIYNEVNLGFAGAANRGLMLAAGHAVLLNSDTVLPPQWLSRMLAPFAADKSVASVTPFSNSATLASFPAADVRNAMPANMSVAAVDAVFRECITASAVDIPTGVGFCLALSASALRTVGFLDADAFAPMYAEENDWCMRARRAGLRNVLAPNLFVQHRDGASQVARPGGERATLIARQLAVLEQLHPGYHRLIAEHLGADPLREIRDVASLILAQRHSGKSAIVIVHNPTLMGGSSIYLEQRLGKLRDEYFPIIFEVSEHSAALVADVPWGKVRLPIDLEFPPAFANFFRQLLTALNTESFFVNQLVGTDIWSVLGIIAASGIPYSYFVHDYFAACPTINLVRSDGSHCGGETDQTACQRCLGKIVAGQIDTPVQIGRWRSLFGAFLQGARSVIAPSTRAADLMRRYYPNVTFTIEPHRVSVPILHRYDPNFAADPILTIGVLGAIGAAKGSQILYSLAEAFVRFNYPCRIKVVGYTDRHEHPYRSSDGTFEVLGAYAVQDGARLLAEQRAALVLLPSIWPETFQYTADEALAAGFPVVAFNLGAAAERIKLSGGGWVLDDVHVLSIIGLIEQLLGNRSLILDAAERLQSCRPTPELLLPGARP